MKNQITKKRFVLANSLLGKGLTIVFTNKKNETYTYDHDEVYSTHQEKFETMNCFQEYGSYTNSNTVPKFCRDLSEVEKPEITE